MSLEQTRAALSGLEREQARADELSDRLRREAARVSELARLLALRDRLARERASIAQACVERGTQIEQRMQEWRALWSPLGIEPKDPASMHAWLLQVSARLDARAPCTRPAQSMSARSARRFEEDGAIAGALSATPDTSSRTRSTGQ